MNIKESKGFSSPLFRSPQIVGIGMTSMIHTRYSQSFRCAVSFQVNRIQILQVCTKQLQESRNEDGPSEAQIRHTPTTVCKQQSFFSRVSVLTFKHSCSSWNQALYPLVSFPFMSPALGCRYQVPDTGAEFYIFVYYFISSYFQSHYSIIQLDFPSKPTASRQERECSGLPIIPKGRFNGMTEKFYCKRIHNFRQGSNQNDFGGMMEIHLLVDEPKSKERQVMQSQRILNVPPFMTSATID